MAADLRRFEHFTGILHSDVSGAMNRRSASGFTLIELLVVIAVLGIVAMLLLPAFSRGKASALSVACMSNLRQFGIALNLYTQEHGCYPPHAYRPTDPSTASSSQIVLIDTYGWPGYLLPHLSGNRDIFRCPARGSDFQWPTNRTPLGYEYPFNLGSIDFPWSYGYNGLNIKQARGGFYTHGGYGLSPSGTFGLSANLVSQPSEMIAIGDSDGNGLGDGIISFMRPQVGLPPDFPPGNVHKKGANIVFCDGHVEWQKQARWIELTPQAARRWHYDNQPHSEAWYRSGP
jgi:prepilin-type N-terminal cleavage/methylation domain-containing protein/prepilin-type processing-associated H-X9-DG protein